MPVVFIYSDLTNSIQSQRVSTLLYLDDGSIIHPVRHTNEIKDIVPISRPHKLPLASSKVEKALTRLKNIPFEQVAHFTQLGNYVRKIQAIEKICDVTIHIETKKYAAHRVSLACYSDYFAEIFNNRKGKMNVPLNIKLQGINPVAFEVLLKYIYTGVLQITSEVASDLMTMSETLKMPRVKTLVTEYMESLPLEDALAIVMKHEKTFEKFYEQTMVAACEQFNTIKFEAVFLDMDIEVISTILSSDNLNISSELVVFKTAIRWITYDIAQRKQHFLRLMKCVRFPFMTQDELFHCHVLTDLFKEDDGFMKMFLEANW